MARACDELLMPARYPADAAGPEMLWTHTKLRWYSSDEPTGEETSIAVALIELNPTPQSLARIAMDAANLMEGVVEQRRLPPGTWTEAFTAVTKAAGIEHLDSVVAVNGASAEDLQIFDHIPGIGLPGMPGTCFAITDRPDLLDASKFDVVVTAETGVSEVALRVFRLLSTLTASTTSSCLDSFEVAEVLSLGNRVVMVTVYWNEISKSLFFPSTVDMETLTSARGGFWTDHVFVTATQRVSSIKVANSIRALFSENADVRYDIALRQRADTGEWPLRPINILCSL